MVLSGLMNKALIRLMAGFRRFREKYYQVDENHHSVYEKLASVGQSPKTLLIGCSDSRVDPAILTEAEPGDLFVVRNVANLVPPCEPSAVGFHGTSSAIEFAVTNLKVENVIVLGHRQCGGIRALMEGATDQPRSFVGQWMSIAEEARTNVLKRYPNVDDETKWRMGELESIKVSIKNLLTFPFVKEAVHKGELNLLGLFFDLEQGQLLEYDAANDDFRPIPI